MDPLTQGLLGAAAAQALFGRRLGRRAALMGGVAGMAADLDVLVRSATDPLLAVEVHRQFSHALAFIPLGGALTALPWLLARRNRRDWRPVLAATTLGYATHGLLDACTTYGTQLFWPFSRERVALNWVSIIDPVFTLLLLAGVVLAARRRNRRPAALALALSLAYLGVGAWQEGRALQTQARIAEARGHIIARGAVFPTLGNQIVWRSLYRAGDTLYADRIRAPWWGRPQWWAGSRVAALDASDLPAEALADPRVRRDLERFRWFSDGWLARAPGKPGGGRVGGRDSDGRDSGGRDFGVIGDVRYSLRTDAFEPVWGVRFQPGAARPTEWVNRTADRRLGLATLWAEILGRKD